MDRLVATARWTLAWFVLFLVSIPPVGAFVSLVSLSVRPLPVAAAVALAFTLGTFRRYSPWWPGKYALRAWGATFVLGFVVFVPLRLAGVESRVANFLIVALAYAWAYHEANRTANDSTGGRLTGQ